MTKYPVYPCNALDGVITMKKWRKEWFCDSPDPVFWENSCQGWLKLPLNLGDDRYLLDGHVSRN